MRWVAIQYRFYLFENPLQVLARLLEHLANAIWVVFVAMRNEPTPYMAVPLGDATNHTFGRIKTWFDESVTIVSPTTEQTGCGRTFCSTSDLPEAAVSHAASGNDTNPELRCAEPVESPQTPARCRGACFQLWYQTWVSELKLVGSEGPE